METLFSEYGLLPTRGLRDCFFIRKPEDTWIMILKIRRISTIRRRTRTRFSRAGFRRRRLPLETMDDTFPLRGNGSITAGTTCDASGSEARTREMIEETMPWDISRRQNVWQQDIFIPVRSIQEEL
jgi:hypothetical protein